MFSRLVRQYAEREGVTEQMKAENQMLKEATRRAFSGCFSPMRRAIRVPPPVPAMLATAIQTLKMGRIRAAPATM